MAEKKLKRHIDLTNDGELVDHHQLALDVLDLVHTTADFSTPQLLIEKENIKNFVLSAEKYFTLKKNQKEALLGGLLTLVSIIGLLLVSLSNSRQIEGIEVQTAVLLASTAIGMVTAVLKDPGLQGEIMSSIYGDVATQAPLYEQIEDAQIELVAAGRNLVSELPSVDANGLQFDTDFEAISQQIYHKAQSALQQFRAIEDKSRQSDQTYEERLAKETRIREAQRRLGGEESTTEDTVSIDELLADQGESNTSRGSH